MKRIFTFSVDYFVKRRRPPLIGESERNGTNRQHVSFFHSSSIYLQFVFVLCLLNRFDTFRKLCDESKFNDQKNLKLCVCVDNLCSFDLVIELNCDRFDAFCI